MVKTAIVDYSDDQSMPFTRNSPMWTLFNYLYRDAGNHKAFGRVALQGRISPADKEAILAKFDGGDLFVAEQIDVPALYEQLYRWTNGPTKDDHCWHEWDSFEEIENFEVQPDVHSWGLATDFVAKIGSVECWEGELSPHFYIGAPMHS